MDYSLLLFIAFSYSKSPLFLFSMTFMTKKRRKEYILKRYMKKGKLNMCQSSVIQAAGRRFSDSPGASTVALAPKGLAPGPFG
jgi:hypothetical protein